MDLTTIWPDLVKIVLLVLDVLAMAGGVNWLVDQLKNWLQLEDAGAKWLAWVVRGVVGVLNAVAIGQISPESFTSWVDMFVLIITIFMASEGIFKFRQYRTR